MSLPFTQMLTIEQMVEHCLNPLTEASHLRTLRIAIGLVQLGYRGCSQTWQELDDLRSILAVELPYHGE
jgi:hypothetical protein